MNRRPASRPAIDGGAPGPFAGSLAVWSAIFLPAVAVAVEAFTGLYLVLAYVVSKLRRVIARLGATRSS